MKHYHEFGIQRMGMVHNLVDTFSYSEIRYFLNSL